MIGAKSSVIIQGTDIVQHLLVKLHKKKIDLINYFFFYISGLFLTFPSWVAEISSQTRIMGSPI